jgi:hypothetical protein
MENTDQTTNPLRVESTRLLSMFQDAVMYRGKDYLPGTEKRIRWIAADAIRDQAKLEERSMAARLRNAAGNIENGSQITKKAHDSIGTSRWSKIRARYLKRCRDLLG